jgi:hypothetical protein
MYEVDENDRVVALEGIPQSSVGAPEPVIISDERRVVPSFLPTACSQLGWKNGSNRGSRGERTHRACSS